MKAALVEQARARGISPSEFLRATLAHALESGSRVVAAGAPDDSLSAPQARSRLSLRMPGEDRLTVLQCAREAGLTPGAFVTGLVAGVPVLTSLGQLVSFFRQGSSQAAHEYRLMLDGVADQVREHIKRCSAVLAELRPCRASPPSTKGSGGQRV
jgi:hypothetical protein